MVEEYSFLEGLADSAPRRDEVLRELTTPEDLLTQLTDAESAQITVYDLGYEITPGEAQLKIPPNWEGLTDVYLEPLRNFVRGVLLTDTFGNQHQEQRIPWEEQQSPAVRSILETNRIGINNLGQRAVGYFTAMLISASDKPSFWQELSEVNPEKQTELAQLERAMTDIIDYFDSLQEQQPFSFTETDLQATLASQAQEEGKTISEFLGELSFREFVEQELGFTWDPEKQLYLSRRTRTINHYDDQPLETKVELTQKVTGIATQVLLLFGSNVTPRGQMTPEAA